MCGGRSKPAPPPPPAPAPPMEAMQIEADDAAERVKKKEKSKSQGTKKYRNPVMNNMSINTAGSSTSGGGLNIGG